jgi:hypothetical protein
LAIMVHELLMDVIKERPDHLAVAFDNEPLMK